MNLQGYKNIDYNNILAKLEPTIPNENIPLKDFLKAQVNYAGNLAFKDKSMINQFFCNGFEFKIFSKIESLQS